jgi:hypothetical protein
VRFTLQSLEDAARRGVQVTVLADTSSKLSVNNSVTVRHIYTEGRSDSHEALILDRMAVLEFATLLCSAMQRHILYEIGIKRNCSS